MQVAECRMMNGRRNKNKKGRREISEPTFCKKAFGKFDLFVPFVIKNGYAG